MQRLLKLEEVEIKVGEEPKGEIMVVSSGDTLRPSGEGTTFTQIIFLFV